MSLPKVLLDLEFQAFLAEMFAPHCQFVDWSVAMEGSDAERAEIDAVVTHAHPHVNADFLARLPNCKVVSNYGVGVDHIVVSDCVAAGIPLGNTPGAVNGATADLTMGILLAAARNIVKGDRYARSAEFKHVDPGVLLGKDVFGATLGIVGMGAIGREVAKRARGFDMNVIYHNRRRDEAAEGALDARYVSLDELLSSSDFVSINVPLSAETTGLIGRRELGLMRVDAFFVNAARGGVVDTDALYEVLRDGSIAGAALDVTEPEPLPRDHPLLAQDNVVLLPHLGTSTVDTRKRMAVMAVNNLVAGLAGAPLPNTVTKN